MKVEVQWPNGQMKISLSILVCLKEDVRLINDNFHQDTISKHKTTRLLTTELKTWIARNLSILCVHLSLIAILAATPASSILVGPREN